MGGQYTRQLDGALTADWLFDGALAQRYRTTFEQDNHSKEDEERDRFEQALEEGLQETFPASDAVSQPGRRQ
jgi:hypothetical protein